MTALIARTGASVGVHTICARATVLARDRRTVVGVGLAVGPGKARGARARVGVETICARATVLTRVRRTVVDVGLALGSGEPARTGARVLSDISTICALPSVLAWARRAIVVRGHKISHIGDKRVDGRLDPVYLGAELVDGGLEVAQAAARR